MAFQTVFKRYELKYMLTLEQKEKILESMSLYMDLDKYGRTTIRNIYFDTDNYRLIRRSIEKPAYKEKIRIRSYAQAVKVKTTNMGSMFRLTYNVTLKDATKEKQMIDHIRERNGNFEIMVSKQENRVAEL